jgi:hypothetical protein
MLRLKADIGPSQLDQPGTEILSAILDGATQNRPQPFETADRQPVKKCLFIGEMTERRSMANA